MMTTPSPQPEFTQPTTTLHWPSLIQFALSLVASVGLLGLAAAPAISGLFDLMDSATPTSMVAYKFLLATSLALAGALLLPSAAYALMRIIGRPVSLPSAWRKISPLAALILPVLLVPLVLMAGYWITNNAKGIAWWALPPLHILGVGLPILWLVALGTRNLPKGSPQRAWGVFGSSLVLGPAIILIIEIAAVIALVILFFVYLLLNPDTVDEISRISDRLMFATTDNAIERILGPYFANPGVIFAFLAYIAGIVPLIEELFKIIGVWLVGGRKLTPAAGFTAGIFSGAAFALFENLGNATDVDTWAVIATTRISTGLMHIVTAGLTGWALALAWSQRRYLRLALTFLLSVCIHGLWNATAIIGNFATIVESTQPDSWLVKFSGVGTYGLAAYTVILFIILILCNRYLQPRQELAYFKSETPPPDDESLTLEQPDL